MIYNIPFSMTRLYRDRRVVLRTKDLVNLGEVLRNIDPGNILYIQLTEPSSGIAIQERDKYDGPVDLVLTDPGEEFPILYSYSEMFAVQPFRVTVPVFDGFGRAVRLAASLNLPVKLMFLQPEPHLFSEIKDVLNFYAHNTTVSQPVEFFHSMIMALCNDTPDTIWDIQEEHPAAYRYIDDNGREFLSGKFAGKKMEYELDGFLERFMQNLIDENAECCTCPFNDRCCGYFKWPEKEYACEGIKLIFQMMMAMAEEMRNELTSLRSRQERRVS